MHLDLGPIVPKFARCSVGETASVMRDIGRLEKQEINVLGITGFAIT